LLFNASCNKQVFSKPWKNLTQIRLIVFKRNAKKRISISKN